MQGDVGQAQTTSAYLLPSFKYVPFISFGGGSVGGSTEEELLKGYLLPEKLHPMHDGASEAQRQRLTRQPESQKLVRDVRDVEEILVLICGHGGRDRRCGLFGPVLRAEFEARLPERGVEVLEGPVEVDNPDKVLQSSQWSARVGLISHIGGHKFAGNVIIYLPPGLKTAEGKEHPLAGHGIWYGRVEPRHVDGIVAETILKGTVIEELLRGGINQRGDILRI